MVPLSSNEAESGYGCVGLIADEEAKPEALLVLPVVAVLSKSIAYWRARFYTSIFFGGIIVDFNLFLLTTYCLNASD